MKCHTDATDSHRFLRELNDFDESIATDFWGILPLPLWGGNHVDEQKSFRRQQMTTGTTVERF